MSALEDTDLQAVLTRLHAEAAGDSERWAQRKREQAGQPSSTEPDPLVRLGGLYMAFSSAEGELLYILARSMKAEHIVEFGASFGVSTLYLAAAARDSGGLVTTTEVHPDKCKAMLKNVEAAGLAAQVRLLQGDARATLAEVAAPIDLLVLDGWKGMYMEVLALLRPKLRSGALVIADNISHPAAQDYLRHVQDPANGFQTHLSGELALSCLV